LLFAHSQDERNPETKHSISEDLKPTANRCEDFKIRRLCMFLKILRTSNDYFPEQYYETSVYNGKAVL
jgi:hypothetical protein